MGLSVKLSEIIFYLKSVIIEYLLIHNNAIMKMDHKNILLDTGRRELLEQADVIVNNFKYSLSYEYKSLSLIHI